MEFPIITSKYDHVNTFINTVGPLAVNEYIARKGCKKIFPSTVVAMACLESGYNLNATTLFGIKGDGVYAPTTEYVNGTWLSIEASFKTYPTIAEAIKGLYDLMQWSHYDLVTSALTNDDECKYLQICGYATDPCYADKLISIINDYGLSALDEYASNRILDLEETKEETEEETEGTCTYTVQAGDTLWGIVARFFNLNDNSVIYSKIKEIAELNGLSNPDMIYAGQILLLI